MVQPAPPGPADGAAAKTKPQTRTIAATSFTVSAAAAANVPASAAIVAALASATAASALPPANAEQTVAPTPAQQSMPAPATPVRAPTSSTVPAPPATPKKKKADCESLSSLSVEVLIRIIEEKDAKHSAMLDQFNKLQKRYDRLEAKSDAMLDKLTDVLATGTGASAATAPPSALTASLVQPGLSISSFPALGATAPTGDTVARPSYSAAAASAPAAAPEVDARARARAALAPRRAVTIRNDGGDGPREVPAEALAPLFVKIARQPIRGLRQALQQLRIPTSLIHDYAFVRENTLQMIALKDGRERLIAALRHEGIEVFDEFDPTRPRHADASSAEHDYARERFRRVAASSIAHAEKQGSTGVVLLFEEWLKRMETAHETVRPPPASSPASVSISDSVPGPGPASSSASAPVSSSAPAPASGSAPAPSSAAAAQSAENDAAAPGAGSTMAPEGLEELPRGY
ncbi:hypothetical protein V8E36_008249 [Tilletia maclaganii]